MGPMVSLEGDCMVTEKNHNFKQDLVFSLRLVLLDFAQGLCGWDGFSWDGMGQG
jgi:hypothetical protein